MRIFQLNIEKQIHIPIITIIRGIEFSTFNNFPLVKLML